MAQRHIDRGDSLRSPDLARLRPLECAEQVSNHRQWAARVGDLNTIILVEAVQEHDSSAMGHSQNQVEFSFTLARCTYTETAFDRDSSAALRTGVTCRAKCNKVLLGIIAGATAESWW